MNWLRILGVDVVYVGPLSPADWMVEVGGIPVVFPLVGSENVLEQMVAGFPDLSIDILIALDAIEIIEVHLVCLFSLPAVQAEFLHHLVCEDASLNDGVVNSLGR